MTSLIVPQTSIEILKQNKKKTYFEKQSYHGKYNFKRWLDFFNYYETKEACRIVWRIFVGNHDMAVLWVPVSVRYGINVFMA